MNKDETQILKGIVILMMVFGHLFFMDAYVLQCENNIWIGDIPLAQFLTRMMGPVPFFLMFSGYGLWFKREGVDKNRFNRVIKLFVNYWIILTTFLLIGHFISPQYPGNLTTIVSNYTGYNTTYNAECWFLLPFAILSLTSRFFLKIFDHFKSYIVIGISLVVNLATSYFISRYGDMYLYKNMYIYIPYLVIHFLFPFYLGAACAKEKWIESARKKLNNISQIYLITTLIIVAVIRCFFNTSIIQTEFAFIFISLFLSIKRPFYIDKALSMFGEHSMNIWMIHTWFCYYLFKDFIYGFEYPPLIFVVTFTLSLAVSFIINFLISSISTLQYRYKTTQHLKR